MMKFLPPRLRMPVQMMVGGSIVTVIGVIFSGWVKITLWPLVVLVALIPLSLLAGWALYREHPGGREQQAGH